jgi:molybdate transport system substrate-binding protein
MRCLRRRALGLAAVGLVARGAAVRAEAPPLIAAASDLQFALGEVARAFTAETGREVRLAFGSSGNFARQIRQGAPFEMFLSADEQYVLDLARDGFGRGQGALYAVGRIVLMVPHGSPLRADGSLGDLAAALDDGRVQKFAIANPEHAPYGKRAQEALRHRELWERLQPKLVLGENVSQAAQFALSGSTQGGIIAYSLALSPVVSAQGSFELIPAGWHEPLQQRMMLMHIASPAAEQFYGFVQEPTARAIMRRFGFLLPGEAS